MKQGRIISGCLILWALALTVIFTGCGGFGLAYKEQMSGKYGLIAVDTLEQMNVSELLPNGDAVGVIPSTVFAAGWDEHFIIAKQHPCDAAQHPNKSITNFYILRVSDGTLTGPMDESSFNEERAKFNVSTNLSFSVLFENLK